MSGDSEIPGDGEAGEALVELACGDPSTLVLDDRGVARTATAVFVDARQVPGADPASFTLAGRGFAKDARNVYRDDGHVVTILPGADPASFVRLDATFAKDRHQAFCLATPIAGAAPETFVVLQDGHARDRDRRYRCERGQAVVVDRVAPVSDDIPL